MSKTFSPNGDGRNSLLNLTGSPLKDDISISELINHSIATNILLAKPWNDVEESYTPVDISLAREIMMNLNSQNFPKDSCGTIFMLCLDEGAPDNNATFLLSCTIKADQNIRGFGNYHGVVKHEEKSINELLKRHFLVAPNTRLNSQTESFFEITPDVSLKFVNITNGQTLSVNHIDESSEVVLYQVVKVGKSHVLCEDFWSQIHLLNMIKMDIISFKNNSCDGTVFEPAYNYGLNDMTFENLQDKVTRILSEVNVVAEDQDAIVDTGLEAVMKRVRHRTLVEISDQLWDILKFTSSYADLKKILTFIFQIASRSNVINIPMSNNRLSELIRELSQQRLAIPHLIGTEPLELLLEIGIEKLLKDYEFILAESRICKLSEFCGGTLQVKGDKRLSVRKSLAVAAVDLNQSAKMRKTLLKTGSFEGNDDEDVGIRNSRFVEREAESNISKLAQIHLVLEHLLLIQNNLSMENDYSAITKKLFEKPLVAFEDLQYQKLDKFEISINDKKVIHLVEHLIPNAQKFTLQSENKFKDVTSVFYFDIEQIVPSLAQNEQEGEVVDKSGDSFHFSSYTTIASRF